MENVQLVKQGIAINKKLAIYLMIQVKWIFENKLDFELRKNYRENQRFVDLENSMDYEDLGKNYLLKTEDFTEVSDIVSVKA